MKALTIYVALLSGTLLSSAASWAQGVVENVAVRNRLYSLRSRFELSPSVGVSAAPHLTRHFMFTAAAAYNLTNVWAFEVRAGYAASGHTALAREVAEAFLRLDPSRRERITDDLSALWEMKANGSVSLRWAPVYGKISLLSELPVHFQAYLSGGAGVGQFHRESIVYCKRVVSRDDGRCGEWLDETAIRPLASVAFGLRFFSHSSGSIKLELRDYFFPDRYLTSIDRLSAERGDNTGTPASSPGLIHLVTFELGYAFIF